MEGLDFYQEQKLINNKNKFNRVKDILGFKLLGEISFFLDGTKSHG